MMHDKAQKYVCGGGVLEPHLRAPALNTKNSSTTKTVVSVQRRMHSLKCASPFFHRAVCPGKGFCCVEGAFCSKHKGSRMSSECCCAVCFHA